MRTAAPAVFCLPGRPTRFCALRQVITVPSFGRMDVCGSARRRCRSDEIVGRRADVPPSAAAVRATRRNCTYLRVRDHLVRRIVAGSFPGSSHMQRTSERRQRAWYEQYVNTLDPATTCMIGGARDSCARKPVRPSCCAWRCHPSSGQLVNLTDLGGRLGLNRVTAGKSPGSPGTSCSSWSEFPRGMLRSSHGWSGPPKMHAVPTPA